MDGHHLILGELTDFLTGEVLADTHDERYRQNLARLLVEKKGYAKNEVTARRRLMVHAGDRKAVVPVDFIINLNNRACMVIKYGPGSLVTRHRPSLAISRLLTPYQIPVVVVTNGIEADILDGDSGQVISSDLDSIPSRSQLLEQTTGRTFKPISHRQADLESRIVYCYEVDDSCPCDDTICRL